MVSPHQCWKVRYKNRFLSAILGELAGNARISFEGKLKIENFERFPGASFEETSILKRNTTWPRQDFAILPLEPSTIHPIIAAIGGTIPRDVRHIQIEKDGRLEFAAWDKFHRETIYLGEALSAEFIDSIVSAGLLHKLEASPAGPGSPRQPAPHNPSILVSVILVLRRLFPMLR